MVTRTRPARRDPAVPGSTALSRLARSRHAGRAVTAVLRRARSAAVRERYRDAWVLADRANEADDNGERLFEHLRSNRPDINAWFAISGEPPTMPGSARRTATAWSPAGRPPSRS